MHWLGMEVDFFILLEEFQLAMMRQGNGCTAGFNMCVVGSHSGRFAGRVDSHETELGVRPCGKTAQWFPRVVTSRKCLSGRDVV